jgi:hypothetical protein
MTIQRLPIVELARRTFVVGWLVITIVGGLSHRIWASSPLQHSDFVYRLLPHLRYGYVMFSDIPSHVTTMTYRSTPGAAELPVAEIVPTPAWGYKNARTALNLLLYPEYGAYICHRLPDRHAQFVQRLYSVEGSKRALVAQRVVWCRAWRS